ncbi:mBOAT family protein [Clostridium sp. CAG:793]|nr:mBOAT family protein [Clostridium sp. CAG:793]
MREPYVIGGDMLFNSITFIYYFLPIVLIIYFAVPKKLKNIVLLISSIIFYAYGEPRYVILMIIEIILAYIGRNNYRQT